MRKRVLFAALLAGVCSLGVAACGGSSDDGTVDRSPGRIERRRAGHHRGARRFDGGRHHGGGHTAAADDGAAAGAAGKAVFTSNCGSCHTLADAGTTGAVGPNLDDLKPDAARVSTRSRSAVARCPRSRARSPTPTSRTSPAYVSSVAGK